MSLGFGKESHPSEGSPRMGFPIDRGKRFNFQRSYPFRLVAGLSLSLAMSLEGAK